MGVGAATLGSAVIGGFTSMNASSQAARASAQATAVQREQLDFQRERYDDWKQVYGVLQEDLGTYYKNLTGESLSNKNREAIQLAGQEANSKISKTLAQRGISGSGMEAQLLSMNDYNTELKKATVTANADELANQEKMNFLRLGINQGGQIAGQMGNTSNNMANMYSQQANQQTAIAQSGVGMVQSALGTYAGWKAGK